MKKTFVIALALISMNCFADANSELLKIEKLTLQGFKAIRHDALVRLRFGKVHEMNMEINKLEADIKSHQEK